ncbi:tenascin-R [Elysia marginata]|uniref:Tenascin-R n=1 Tax=Elysia marginata TaxID=1093978 RepID=A0AAV4G2P7_9GAST|nr:tenascin-R [Elysia marginata]
MDLFLGLAFLFLVLKCQGLEFSLEKKTTAMPYTRSTCGVLLCVQNAPKDINATLINDQRDWPSQAASISSLKVFQIMTTSSNSNNDVKRRFLLASVTTQQPRMTRVSNGIKVDGKLDIREATLRLELAKEVDCQAEFVCEARGVDVEGTSFVRASHILQRPQGNDNHRNELSWAPGSTAYVMSLLHQLDAKLAVVGSIVNSLEDKMGHLKDTRTQDIQSVRNDLNTKTDRLEDKIVSLGKDVDAQTDRLEDKIMSLQKDLVMKTGLPVDKNGVNGMSKSQIGTETMFSNANTSVIKDSLDKLGTDMQTNYFNINKQIKAWQAKFSQTLDNASENRTCENSLAIADTLTGGLDSIKSFVNKKFQDMSFQLNATTFETRPFFDAQSLKENLTFRAELQSVMTELLKPKNCFKGMASVPLVSRQYTIIHPNNENDIEQPVLCDALTDGGGWIVFQRHSTGTVNFYRGWEDYKRGFGSLDGDFWLGNDIIHAITGAGLFELRVDLRYNDKSVFAHYKSFSVGDEKSLYTLHVAHYSGTAGDSLIKSHNGKPFSTHDRDNDKSPHNCAVVYVGAWWYKDCHDANLNGQWKGRSGRGPMWRPLTGDNGVSYSEMKMRRVL